MVRSRDNKGQFTRRAAVLGGGKLLLFGALAGRMYQLQVREAGRYSTLAEENRINLRFEPPPRGIIQDRFGRILAANRQTFRVSVVSERAKDLEAVLDELHAIVSFTPEDRARVIESAARQRAFVAVPVVENLTWEEMARVSVRLPDLPGIEVDETRRRIYPVGSDAAHIVGYVGPVAKDELTGDPVLALPDFRIGKSGIELTHDQALRGTAARSRVEVNAVGRVIRELDRTDSETGKPVTLAVDSELQSFVRNRFGEDTGSAVVLDVHTGEVLSMMSAPDYDPTPFDQGIDPKIWNALLSDPDAPLSNKAISGQYAPGSTFKMVVAMAALEYGLVGPNQSFFCKGVLDVGKGRFHCWRRGGHGWMSLRAALTESCDIYFYEVARRVGIDRIAEMAGRLGFGAELGIDLPNEKEGLIPTKAWKRRRFDQPWQIGETLISGIGQGFVLATPLQLAVMTARLVNGGRAITPRLTRFVGDDPVGPDRVPSLGFSPASLKLVGQGMRGVMTSPHGTAHSHQIPVREYWMGGKTGTAQVRRITAKERRTGVRTNEDLPREYRDHALFVGYAPLDEPRYAVSVIVEHGGSGSRVAAPIAGDILLEVQVRDSSRPDGPSASVPTTLQRTRRG